MNEMNIKGLVRTMLDGLKDASMQYEWAMNAHRSGDKELAALHHAEAGNGSRASRIGTAKPRH